MASHTETSIPRSFAFCDAATNTTLETSYWCSLLKDDVLEILGALCYFIGVNLDRRADPMPRTSESASSVL